MDCSGCLKILCNGIGAFINKPLGSALLSIGQIRPNTDRSFHHSVRWDTDQGAHKKPHNTPKGIARLSTHHLFLPYYLIKMIEPF